MSTNRSKFVPYGLDEGNHAMFNAVHILPISLLAIGASLSLTLIFVFLKPWKGFYERPVGERLATYLAICDFLYSLAHFLDHAYILATFDFPPDPVCAALGFLLTWFGFAQTMVVMVIAFNAFVMVVKERRIPYGKYDWKLLLFALGVPLMVCTVTLATGHFGPSGAW